MGKKGIKYVNVVRFIKRACLYNKESSVKWSAIGLLTLFKKISVSELRDPHFFAHSRLHGSYKLSQRWFS